MFGFNLCKNLRRAVVVRNSALFLQLHFPHSPSILVASSFRCISSIESSTNENSFTVSYLINSCGLSPESAFTASKHLLFKTVAQPDSVISLLKKLGFSKTEIATLVERYPRVLKCKPEATLSPKLKFFQSKGFSSSDITKILSSEPSLWRRNLEDQIIPAFNFLYNSFHYDNKTIVALKHCHSILCSNMENTASKITLLRDKGVSEPNIVRLLHRSLILFINSSDKVEKVVDEAIHMGFDPSKGLFPVAVRCLSSMSKCTWDKKVGVYKRWNLSESEILSAFGKLPDFMRVSEDKINAVMDLFVNDLDWESSVIVKDPVLVMSSLDKRLIPRASVFKFLVTKGLVHKSFRSTAFFRHPEGRFMQKFVNCYAEAPAILKLYKKRSVLSRSRSG